MAMNQEMRDWLAQNNETYEFYLMHAIMHDPLKRMSLINTPLEPDDFSREPYALLIKALSMALHITSLIDSDLPYPPTVEFMKTYVASAGEKLGAEDTEMADCLNLVAALQDPSYKEMHYVVGPYFSAWYSSGRAKRSARKDIQMQKVPDVGQHVQVVQEAVAAAERAIVTPEEDEMYKMINNKATTLIARQPTGIVGLDQAFNGGWGPGECYLLFGGTKAGKSIAAAQCAWNQLQLESGWPLIVSTEMPARKYVVRIVSNACGIPIGKLQDCTTFDEIRGVVAGDQGSRFNLERVEKVLQTIATKLRVAKVNSDDALNAAGLIEREMLMYESIHGRYPTWICLDWLGTLADVNGGGQESSKRAAMWEHSANSIVKFTEKHNIPTLVLAQAVNNSQQLPLLTIDSIGIAKGIGKQMTVVVGITNLADKKAIMDAATGKGELPDNLILEDQLFCVCASRIGDDRPVPVRRDFRYQRFVARPRHD